MLKSYPPPQHGDVKGGYLVGNNSHRLGRRQLRNGTSDLWRPLQGAFVLFSPHTEIWKGVCSPKRVLIRAPPCWHPGLRCSVSRTLRNQIPLVIRLWHQLNSNRHSSNSSRHSKHYATRKREFISWKQMGIMLLWQGQSDRKTVGRFGMSYPLEIWLPKKKISVIRVSFSELIWQLPREQKSWHLEHLWFKGGHTMDTWDEPHQAVRVCRLSLGLLWSSLIPVGVPQTCSAHDTLSWSETETREEKDTSCFSAYRTQPFGLQRS